MDALDGLADYLKEQGRDDLATIVAEERRHREAVVLDLACLVADVEVLIHSEWRASMLDNLDWRLVLREIARVRSEDPAATLIRLRPRKD